LLITAIPKVKVSVPLVTEDICPETDHLKVNYGILKKEEKTRRITLAAMPGGAVVLNLNYLQHL
jgi:hypothetical protein